MILRPIFVLFEELFLFEGLYIYVLIGIDCIAVCMIKFARYGVNIGW